MKPGGGKQKGSEFERKICKALSLWVSKGAEQDLFWRSAMSGGRATVSLRKGVKLNRQAGDLCAVAPEGHSLTNRYYVECKDVKSLQMGKLLVENKGICAGFWEEAKTKAAEHSRLPMLIAKELRGPIMVVVPPHKMMDMLVRFSNVRAFSVAAQCEVWMLDDMVAITYYDGLT